MVAVLEDPIIDTVPTTPIPNSPVCSRTLRRRIAPRYGSSPVPIIAPPLPHLIPIPPRSERSWARLRLTRFLERERRLRCKEELSVLQSRSPGFVPKDEDSCPSTCSPDEMRRTEIVEDTDKSILRQEDIDVLGNREAIEWILTVRQCPLFRVFCGMIKSTYNCQTGPA